MKDQVQAAAERLDRWIEQEGFKGWDPFDALNSALLKRLTANRRRLGQLWVHLFKYSPINFRPLFQVAKDYNPKGMGLFLASYWRKYCSMGQAEDLAHVRFFFDWLRTHVSPGYHGPCWGYNFDWPNRSFFAPAGTPTVVNTGFIGLAFVDVATSPSSCNFSEQQREALATARSACDFMLYDLHTTRPAADEMCLSYTPLDYRCVHNANMLGAWLLAEVFACTTESELAQAALAAARYTARRQRPDGTWPYGDGPDEGWVDNFHTGYVLMALKHVAACLETTEFDEHLHRGYILWKQRMFLPDGAPKFYLEKTYPLDAHCVAQAILTFLDFADRDPEARDLALRVALWGINHLQNPAGYFDYMVLPAYRIRIPYMRWTQAWMQRGLTELLIEAPRGEQPIS